MLKSMLKGLLLAGCMVLPAFAAEDRPPTIKVLLLSQVEKAQLEFSGGYVVYNPENRQYVTRGLLGKDFPVEPLSYGLKWGEEFPGVYQITIVPRTEDSVAYLNEIPYKGAMHIYQVGQVISIINEVAVEDFIKSVLAIQLPGGQSPEVLASLAITARTSSLFEAGRNRTAYWQVEADTVGYAGTIPVANNEPVARAVDLTKYMVLEMNGERNHYFPAVWTENCAGKTASYGAMFRKSGEGVLRGVESPYAERAKSESAWKISVPQDWLAQLAGLTIVSDMHLYADPWSHKVYAVRLSDGKRAETRDFFTLQNFIGKERLHSSDFTVSIEKGNVIFSGYGGGHGVGLCLYSAQQMVRRGKTAADILASFFPDAVLRRDAPAEVPIVRRPGPMKPIR